MNMKKKGFSLIELVIFIVITGIAAVAVLNAFYIFLQKSPSANYQTNVIALAQERMDLILGQRRMKGFSTSPSALDPCNSSTTGICAYPTGYNVTVSFNSPDTSTTIITVTATGPNNSQAVLTTLVES